MENTEIQIVNVEQLAATTKVEIDIQISTAKAYPRNIQQCKDNAIAIATMDQETASSCGYRLTFRGDKPITGKSVHLAKIIAQCWGNLRIQKKIIGVDGKFVIAEAICHDLETNIAIKMESRKPCIKKDGSLYSADMINTTGLAAASIAMREAILTVVPKSISDLIYNKTRDVIAGKLDNETRIIQKRKEMIEIFKNKWGGNIEEILKVVGVHSETAIGKDEIVHLIEINQSLVDKEITTDELFERNVENKIKDKKEQLKNNKKESKNSEPNLL